ncbi:polyketide synthase [Polychaeton citri CBS 116435]|uniref:Polyketide synthase n=1 Tax=Polychaeton citri CBS 116435 TaxID=1314669 RepID=A0A9P4UKL1_9PEZI|nr:polyketide synthase [Polychaeton citri CBS 116435]
MQNGDESGSFEPVAIIGMAMRLPGRVSSAEEFWDLLVQKRSGMCNVPKNRFNIDGFYHPSGKPGTISQTQAYYLENIDIESFDSSVFSITKKELERLDPEQRQILQVAYECMEDSGVTTWRGSKLGCYIGTFGEDWQDINAKETQHRGGWRGTGWSDFALSNRVSYEFDLRGPSMTVKTACSSSLVCLDMACAAIRSGECDGALVGGTSLMFSPATWHSLHDQGLLSPTGECRTFDAAANGYARGEAINMIYVKKLSHAIRDKDPVRAIIRGTCVNTDGRTQGMTTPSTASQAALIRQTYKMSGIEDMSQTAIFECHGTGTPVGDPLETAAVAACFGEKGVIISGVKPNVGHAEGAAGITSVIKAVLCLERLMVPPQINFKNPNPKIAFDKYKLHVPTEVEEWPKDRAERVSVNSFGIGGVNAHAIIDSPAQIGLEYKDPRSKVDPKVSLGCTNGEGLLLFSAYSAATIAPQVEAFKAFVINSEATVTDLAYTLANRRERKPFRSYAVTADKGCFEISASIGAQAPQPRIAWIFTGQGAQWPSMGKELIDTDPVFRATIRKLDRFLLTLPTPPPWNIEQELRKTGSESRVHQAEFGYPMSIAIQVALVDVLRSWGLVPDLIVGHSSGEMSAAYASGAMTAESAMAAATFRSLDNASPSKEGSMAAIGLGRHEISPYLLPGVVIACENSQSSVTLSGDKNVVEEVTGAVKIDRPEVLARALRVERAYHSPHMQEHGPSYEEHLRPFVRSVEPKIPFYSSVTGKRLTGEGSLEASYWRQNMENPVLFNSALRASLRDQDGKVVLIEIGPHPALAGPIGQILREAGRTDDVHIGTLKRGEGCRQSMLHLAGKLFQQNIDLDFEVLCPPGRFVQEVPRYTWVRDTSHWFEPRVAREWRFRQHPPHELLGVRVTEAASEPTWRNMLALDDVPWLDGHQVSGQILFPAAGYITMVGEAVNQLEGEASYSVKDVRIAAARVLDADKPVEMLTSLNPIMLDSSETSPWYSFTISSFDGTKWIKNCWGEVRASFDRSVAFPTTSAPSTSFPRAVDAAKWYGHLTELGFNYTGLFKGMHCITASASSTEASACASEQDQPHSGGYSVHPAVIDQCFQLFTVAAARGLRRNIRQLAVPVFIGEMVVTPAALPMTVKATVESMCRGSFTGRMTVQAAGSQILHLKDFRTSALTSADEDKEELPLISHIQWRPCSDFVDLEKYMQMTQPKAEEWHSLEELALLCSMDHVDQLEILDDTPKHLVSLVEWMKTFTQRFQSGSNIFVSKDAYRSNLDACRRRQRIQELVGSITSAACIAYATAIHRLFESAPAIFRGEKHPLHVLLEDDVLTDLYNAGDLLDYTGAIQLVGNTNPRLRVLEVGAGTGGTTSKVLKALLTSYGERLYSKYVFTDVSSGFINTAKERFADHENIEYAVFDASKDPVQQNFQPSSFDLIICSNVVHATPSLNTTLSHLRALLTPGGRVFLSELCPDSKFINYIMGFLPGWWLGNEDGRAEEPYISPESWINALTAAGFEKPDAVKRDTVVPYTASVGILASKSTRVVRPPSLSLLCRSPGAPYVMEMQRALDLLGVHVDIVQFGRPLPAQNVISLLDLDEPLLHDMTEETFNTLVGYLKSHDAKLFWITRACQVDCHDPRASMMLGLARTARKDLTAKIFTIEIDSVTPPSTATEAVAKIVMRSDTIETEQDDTDPDYEYAISNGEILIPRIHWTTQSASFKTNRNHVDAVLRKRFSIRKLGLLHTICWEEEMVQDVGNGEVRVEVKTAGLNFKDLMISMGVINDSPDQIGLEGAGIILAVGPDVQDFAVGDRVMYMGSGCFSTHKTMKSTLVAKIADTVGFEQAAAIPATYVTALLGLVDKANLQPSQTILIHAACGGVGLAALQIAQMIGAKVYCTVGTEAKVQYLMENYGLKRSEIFSSRDSSFYMGIMSATNNHGVDLVLNSLTGELLNASWACVADYGTMVEIGKRDFRRRAKLPMQAFEQNRTFIGVDVGQLSLQRPQVIADLMRRSTDLIATKKLRGPPIDSVFPASRIRDAFRSMQSANHIGKIIVEMPDDPRDLESVPAKPVPAFRSDCSYLLVGGLGGLGRSVATWMVENGARHLIFLSRSAKQDADTQDFLEELQSQQCTVQIVTGSVVQKDDVQRAVDSAIKPLAGVLNMSMVLKDINLREMTFSDWNAAVEPKVQGTWNLHHAVSSSSLDFFILFSSCSGLIGNNGQANYAAGNTFMDAFVQYRHRHNLPASVIDIGVMAEVGFVARTAGLVERLEKTVMRRLNESQFLDALLLAKERSHLYRGPSNGMNGYENPSQLVLGLASSTPISSPQTMVNWKRDRRMSTYFNLEQSSDISTGHAGKTDSLKNQLKTSDLSTEEKTKMIAKSLGIALADFLIKDHDLPLDRPLESIGVDSLVALEVRNWIRQQVGVEVSTISISQSPSIMALSGEILAALAKV